MQIEIENYQLLEPVGNGGMSTVWRARQLSLDRLVAIKILSAGLAVDKEGVERFLEEARLAARLNHPGIVSVYDAGVSGGVYYFVMELVNGYTVGDWLRKKGRLAETDILTIAENVAAALDYAWSGFKLVHCDLKPDNVMVDHDGSIKITDLGLSRTLHNLSMENEREVFGTPAYMSPEQVIGGTSLDCRSDIYSLGAMLYHLATGHMLFEKHGPQRQMELQVSGQIPDPSVFVPDLSRSLRQVVMRMLTKDRERRQADWREVISDLRGAGKNLRSVSGKQSKIVAGQAASRGKPVVSPKRQGRPPPLARSPVLAEDRVTAISKDLYRKKRVPLFLLVLAGLLLVLWLMREQLVDLL